MNAGYPQLPLVRPALRAVTREEAEEAERPRGPGLWWFRTREAIGTAGWKLVSWLAEHVASDAMRRRAFAAGFGLALGADRNWWLDHLDEYTRGNETAHEIRHRRYGPQSGPVRPFPLPDDVVQVADELEAEWAARCQGAATA